MKMLFLAAALLGVATPALAQPVAFDPPPLKRLVAPAETGAIPLYKGPAPGSEDARYPEVWTGMADESWVRNVTRPTLTPFLPKPGTATGAAVLVVPGGGFKFVSITNEGWPIAKWLADRGIAAFVLKYRVDRTPEPEAEFMASTMAIFRTPRTASADSLQFTPSIALARADAQAALRMIRGNSAKWGVDPARVGMLGFSAGAMTTVATTLADAPDARPDFIAPIYGSMIAITPPAKPQPMFVAYAADDPLFGGQGFGLVESWRKAGGSAELHYYATGGHGFGSHKQGKTSDLWFDQFMAWMGAQGLLKPRK